MFTSKSTYKIFLLLLFLIIISVPVLADGGMYIQQESDKTWKLFNEGTQLCAINYKDGYENMILTVDTREELSGTQAVWIFPIPSSPEKTVINIAKGFPSLNGRELDDSYDEALPEMFLLMSATQIYPLPLLMLGLSTTKSMSFGTLDAQLGESSGIIVYEHIEKYGLTTELVSISSSSALNNYLSSKGLILDDKFISTFGSYVGEDNSLVVSWISNVTQYKIEQASIPRDAYYFYRRDGTNLGNLLGVSITFPTDRIYFPLKPTSIYGSISVPAAIYVMGQVEPHIYSDIKPYTKVTQYYASYQYVPDYMQGFFFNEERVEDLMYTKIEIDAPAKYYTQDLWMDEVSRPITSLKLFMLSHGFLACLIFSIILSILASVIAAGIVFRNDNPDLLKFGLFGMLNTLTLILFAMLARGLRIDQRFTQSKNNDIISADDRKLFWSTAKLSWTIVGILFVLMLLFVGIETNGFKYMGWEILLILFIPLVLVFGILLLFLKPFVWGYYNNRKMMKYMAGFAVSFLLLMLFTWLILSII